MEYGKGKLSYYINDVKLGDGTGSFEEFFVGGLNSNANFDYVGPEIDLFINDTTFVSGGFSDDSPELLAILFDDSGINTVGTGIGHDLVAILDGVTNSPYILNDYYESDLNSFQSGKVLYPFSNLNDGEHTLNFKAWDVHNNSSNAEITFFVTSSGSFVSETFFFSSIGIGCLDKSTKIFVHLSFITFCSFLSLNFTISPFIVAIIINKINPPKMMKKE